MTAEDPPPPATSVVHDDFADCRVVRARGRIDHTGAAGFLDALNDHARSCAEGRALVIDLSGVDFISSAGLRALMVAKRTVDDHNGRIVVTGLSGVVKEVFRISKFDALLPVAETVAEALASISPEAARAYSG